MRQVLESLLGIVDTFDNSTGEFLEEVGKSILLRRSLTSLGAGFGFSGDVTIRVKGAKGPIAFFKNAAGLFDERSDFVNEGLFVAFLLRSAFTSFDRLSDYISLEANPSRVSRIKLTSLICLQIGCTRSRVS